MMNIHELLGNDALEGEILSFIDAGANVNRKCRCCTCDETAPISATNDRDTLEALIKAGADVNLTYGEGRDAANKLGWDLEQLSVDALMTLLHAGAGFFGDRNPAERINSYIANHPGAGAELIRDLIRKNTIKHFDYDPFGNANEL